MTDYQEAANEVIARQTGGLPGGGLWDISTQLFEEAVQAAVVQGLRDCADAIHPRSSLSKADADLYIHGYADGIESGDHINERDEDE